MLQRRNREGLFMIIRALIWQEDDVWCGSIPALKGCHTWGETYEHLLEMLKESAILCLEDESINENVPQHYQKASEK